MTLAKEMIDVFGEDDLIYAVPDRLAKINLNQETREFILNTGFPYIIDYLRFSMDFEAISEDIQIGESVKHLGQVYIIGCNSPTPLVGRMIHLSEIDLARNASLSDIGKRVKLLGIDLDDDVILYSEVTQSNRICLDLENQRRIIYINPLDLSINFLNSSIQQLASSLIAYGHNLFTEKDFKLGIKDFKKELKIIAPQALDSDKNLWIDIIERLIRDNEGY